MLTESTMWIGVTWVNLLSRTVLRTDWTAWVLQRSFTFRGITAVLPTCQRCSRAWQRANSCAFALCYSEIVTLLASFRRHKTNTLSFTSTAVWIILIIYDLPIKNPEKFGIFKIENVMGTWNSELLNIIVVNHDLIFYILSTPYSHFYGWFAIANTSNSVLPHDT